MSTPKSSKTLLLLRRIAQSFYRIEHCQNHFDNLPCGFCHLVCWMWELSITVGYNSSLLWLVGFCYNDLTGSLMKNIWSPLLQVRFYDYLFTSLVWSVLLFFQEQSGIKWPNCMVGIHLPSVCVYMMYTTIYFFVCTYANRYKISLYVCATRVQCQVFSAMAENSPQSGTHCFM